MQQVTLGSTFGFKREKLVKFCNEVRKAYPKFKIVYKKCQREPPVIGIIPEGAEDSDVENFNYCEIRKGELLVFVFWDMTLEGNLKFLRIKFLDKMRQEGYFFGGPLTDEEFKNVKKIMKLCDLHIGLALIKNNYRLSMLFAILMFIFVFFILISGIYLRFGVV